jgi:ribosomal protein S18
MAKNKGTRILITLECTECRSNLNKRSPGVSRYLTQKNRRNNPERLELKKYCPHCNKPTIHKQKTSPISFNQKIDYKDIDLLTLFVTEQGKILPRRATGVTIQQQRKLAKAIKRARILSLFPFVASNSV